MSDIRKLYYKICKICSALTDDFEVSWYGSNIISNSSFSIWYKKRAVYHITDENFEKYSYNVELNYDKDTYILIYKTLSINHKVRDIDIHEIREHCINVMKSWELCDFKNKELKYYNKLKNIEKDFND